MSQNHIYFWECFYVESDLFHQAEAPSSAIPRSTAWIFVDFYTSASNKSPYAYKCFIEKHFQSDQDF